MSATKVLISGGAGFIGSRLSLALLAEGYEVRVLDNLSPQIHGTDPQRTSPLYRSIGDRVPVIVGTVTERDHWRKALEGVEVVVHLAAETGTGQSMYQVHHYTEVNVGGTALLLDILANERTGVRRVVVASSRAIYGEGKYLAPGGQAVYPAHRNSVDMDQGHFEVRMPGIDGPLTLTATDEFSRIHPSSVYGITKQQQEQLVLTVCGALGIEGVALRYQNVYGPGQSLTNPYTGILSIFSSLILSGKPVNIFEDGKESRDFVFIDDVVRATCLAIREPAAAGQVFNVGTGVPTTVLEVASLLCEYYGRNVPLQITGNYRIGDIRHNYADLTLAREGLRFAPSVSFRDGLRAFTDWVTTQEPATSDYEGSLRELREKGLLK